MLPVLANVSIKTNEVLYTKNTPGDEAWGIFDKINSDDFRLFIMTMRAVFWGLHSDTSYMHRKHAVHWLHIAVLF